jgi:hypothetical protein
MNLTRQLISFVGALLILIAYAAPCLTFNE